MQEIKKNYQREMEKIIADFPRKFGERVPRLLIHSCCAPCSSYCLEYLTHFFDITVLYYNPNIFPEEEFYKRISEQKRLIDEMPKIHKIDLIECEHRSEEFYQIAKGYEDCPEGGERCFRCYELRLREAAEVAKNGGYDFFTTTLSISPLKNAGKLCEIGEKVGEEFGVEYLYSDFKKKGGYQRSIQLSREYGLYRQNYCGCVYSQREDEQTKN